jgi:uncharacterized membrane protein
MSQASVSPEVTSDDKLWAALAYVFPVIIPIVLLLMADKKDRPFIKAHNVQALILGILVYVLSFACVGILVWFYMLYLAYQAYQGKLVEVPVITNLCKNQGWA